MQEQSNGGTDLAFSILRLWSGRANLRHEEGINVELTCSRKRILVIDDENLIRWSLCATLEGENYEVHIADSAETATELTRDMDFDLIITDYRLEKENGLEFSRKIKSRSPNTIVFMLTAYGTEELRSRAVGIGVEAFFDKPFDMSSLTKEVKRCLSKPDEDSPVFL